MTALISFSDDGTATALHTDIIPLQSLGTCRIRRASWIDFNEVTQEWEVRFDPHATQPEFSDPSRAACLAWEHDYFLKSLL
jgi:hypothetical protein